eukprot:jgi/Ulvmu1/10415/UM062_0011.1
MFVSYTHWTGRGTCTGSLHCTRNTKGLQEGRSWGEKHDTLHEPAPCIAANDALGNRVVASSMWSTLLRCFGGWMLLHQHDPVQNCCWGTSLQLRAQLHPHLFRAQPPTVA